MNLRSLIIFASSCIYFLNLYRLYKYYEDTINNFDIETYEEVTDSYINMIDQSGYAYHVATIIFSIGIIGYALSHKKHGNISSELESRNKELQKRLRSLEKS